MLIEKWNCKVKIFLKYLMGEVLPYLEAFHLIGESMFTFVQHKPFGMTQWITRADIEFQRLLDSYDDHCNFSYYNMVSNNYL